MFIKECNVVFMSIANSNNIFLLQEIVKKNFSSKYKDSVLGIFWSILKPLLIMIVFTIIFSTLFGRSIENFPVYFLSARCLFDFFNSAIAASMNSIKGNCPISVLSRRQKTRIWSISSACQGSGAAG